MGILKKGDTVGFVAPSSFVKKAEIDRSVKYFNSMGIKVKIADNICEQHRYMAGSDKKRAQIINKMFADKSIKALVCVRGGAGSSRVLPYLDYELIKNNKKPLIGLSDSTGIQNALIKRSSTQSYTGYLAAYKTNQNNADDLGGKYLKSILFDDHHDISSGISLISGEVEGKIIGGNLSVFAYLCGSKYFPDLKNKILLLEDIAEKTYKIDLLLNQIKQQKGFNELKGIIFGKFTDCNISSPEDGTVDDCIKDFISGLRIPVIKDMNYGHIDHSLIIPLGTKVKMISTPEECKISW